MTTLRLGIPSWIARRAIPVRHAPLSGATSTEVVVIGGGLTGSAVALAFAEAGLDVAVLEADRIGLGSTAASTALLMQEPDRDFDELAARYGRRTTERIWRSSIDATARLVATLRRLRIACDLEPRDSLYYATDARSAAALKKEHHARVNAGFGGEWLGPREAKAAAGFAAAAAIRMHGNALVDPYRACDGLARAAARRGARFFERSPATRVEASRSHVDVFTRAGRVRASRVIVATGYATREFASLYARFKLYTTYVLATPRLSRRQRAQLGLGPFMLWDTGRPYHYLRWTSDHCLIAGGDDERRMPDSARGRLIRWHAARLQRHLASLYPSLARVGAAYAWEGLFATTPDGLPYIGPHRRYPRHLFALGYGGNGMTFGFLAAEMLVRHHQGRPLPEESLFSFGR